MLQFLHTREIGATLSTTSERDGTRTKPQEHRSTRVNPRFGHTTKVPYFPVEVPTKSGVLIPTLILPSPTTKIKVRSQTKRRVIQTSQGESTNELEALGQPLTV